MPHMSPIMWAFIMFMTFNMMMIMMTMIYFSNLPLMPKSEKDYKKMFYFNWLW
uniref:ATP synthase F0 subunit 8 n=1 Tax=Pyrgopsella youngi TaxID=432350 RepID=A0A8K1UKY5_9CRUS|nr:ATP synthase F0 subunit 8 [Pyrgopsella youngi]